MMRNKLKHDILILLIMMMLVVHFQSIHVVKEDKLKQTSCYLTPYVQSSPVVQSLTQECPW